jgi:hypothetical protein
MYIKIVLFHERRSCSHEKRAPTVGSLNIAAMSET